MNTIYRPGADYVRSIIARAVAASPSEAITLADTRWGQDVRQITRAAVSGVEAVDLLDSSALASAEAEFVQEAEKLSIFGRLTGVRRVSPRTPFSPSTEASTAYWIGESKAIKASRLAFSRRTLEPLKLASIVIASLEALRADTRAEELMRRDMLRAAAAALDLALIDPDNAGVSGESPASLLFGVSGIAATANPADDLAAMIEDFAGSFDNAVWVTHPKVFAQISARLGLQSELGLRGGLLLGLPALASNAVPISSNGAPLALIDASGIVAVDEGAEVEVARAGMIELDDAPSGATDTPAGATAHAASLFQTESVAVKLSRRINFENGRAGGVVWVDGADYAIGA